MMATLLKDKLGMISAIDSKDSEKHFPQVLQSPEIHLLIFQAPSRDILEHGPEKASH